MFLIFVCKKSVLKKIQVNFWQVADKIKENNDEGDIDDIDKINIVENIGIHDENDVYSFGGKAEVTEGSAGWTASQAGSQDDDHVNFDDVDDSYCDDADDNYSDDDVDDDALFFNPIHSMEYV